MNKLLKNSVLAALVAFGSSASLLANPVTLTAGTFTNSFNSTNANEWGTGTVLASTTSTFTSPTLSGSIYSWVESGVASNPFGPNALTFFYTFENDGFPGSHAVSQLTVDGWLGFATAVAQDGYYAGFSVAPNAYGAGISADIAIRSFDGQVVRFGFQGGVPIGGASFDLIVYSDAASYQLVNAGIIDGTTANNKVLGAAVPDGGMTAALLGLGLLGLGLAARRK